MTCVSVLSQPAVQFSQSLKSPRETFDTVRARPRITWKIERLSYTCQGEDRHCAPVVIAGLGSAARKFNRIRIHAVADAAERRDQVVPSLPSSPLPRGSRWKQVVDWSRDVGFEHRGVQALSVLPAFLGFLDLSVLEAVGVLALIVTVHECGHFLAARAQNIHVTKFAIGFGPVLARYAGPQVEYTLRAIPLGGFVAFPDDDPESIFAPTDPNLLKNRPILDRALVISAGVIANILFAFAVLFTQVNTVGLLQESYLPGVAVPDVVAGSAAERGGLRKGDIILTVDADVLPARPQSVNSVVDRIKAGLGQDIEMQIKRGPDLLSLHLFPDTASDGSGRIGVQLTPNSSATRVVAQNLGEATVLASAEFSRLLFTVWDGLSHLVTNFSQTAERVSGPVAIVAVGAEVARSDAAGLFQYAAIVNLNLAVVNSLPLPALDGGYLALLIVEATRGGKKLPTGLEQGIMSSGILVLLTTGIVLIVRDTLNLGGLL